MYSPLDIVLHNVISNIYCCVLQADRLQLATAEVEQKERRLVTQCLEQFAEARTRLSELREREELTSSRNLELQVHTFLSLSNQLAKEQ